MERLILAAQFASQGRLDSLRALFSSDREYFVLGDPFSPHSVWSVLLLLLPETLDPVTYEPLVRDILNGGLENDAKEIAENGTVVGVVNLPESQIQLRVSRLLGELKRLTDEYGWTREAVDVAQKLPNNYKFLPDNVYNHWLKCRLRAIDRCCGQLDWFTPLLSKAPKEAQDWYFGTANVVNQYRILYSTASSLFTLKEFEQTSPSDNVCRLLSSTSPSHISRDFEKLIVPYISYMNEWDKSLNKWIYQQVEKNSFDLLVPISEVNQSSFLERPLLTACYLDLGYDLKNFEIIRNIYQGIYASSRTNELNHTVDEDEIDHIISLDISSYDFDSLIQSPRTNPTKQSLTLLLRTLNACEILASVGLPANMKFVVNLQTQSCQQKEEDIIFKYLENSKNSWVDIRNDLKVLKSGQLLSHINQDWIDAKIISAALESGDFDFVQQTYNHHNLFPKLVLEQLHSFYNSSTSTGNKSKDHLKNATHCLNLLQSTDSHTTSYSEDIKRAAALINATNEISKYEGVSFTPAELKSKSPLDIVEKILSSNHIGFRELNVLTKIAEALVYANNYDPEEFQIDSISTQIRAMCVTHALVNDNFKVAYDYCVPELTSLQNKSSLVAWTSCYQVGKYVSPFWNYPPLSILEQQLKILSYTLQICPKENIASVLSTWKKNDTLRQEILNEMHSKKHHATTTSAAENTHSTYSSLSASRIAKAISSSAAEFTSSSQLPSEDSQSSGRRQQISNLFVNGLGWAIGANQQSH